MDYKHQKDSHSATKSPLLEKISAKKTFQEYSQMQQDHKKQNLNPKSKPKKSSKYQNVKPRYMNHYKKEENSQTTDGKKSVNKHNQVTSLQPNRSMKKLHPTTQTNWLAKSNAKRVSKTPDVKSSHKKQLLHKSVQKVGAQQNQQVLQTNAPITISKVDPFNAVKPDASPFIDEMPVFANSKVQDVDMEDESDIQESHSESKTESYQGESPQVKVGSPAQHEQPPGNYCQGDVDMEVDEQPESTPNKKSDENWVDLLQKIPNSTEDQENQDTNQIYNEWVKKLTEAGNTLLSEKKQNSKKSHISLKSSIRPAGSVHAMTEMTNQKSVTIITPNRAGILQIMDSEQVNSHGSKQEIKIFDASEWSIDRFQIGKPLSRGKFGHVLLVRERVSKYLFVLKMMFKSQLKKSPKYLRNFRREVEIQSRLDHPNIVKMNGWFTDEKRLYIIMEFWPEGELFTILQNQPMKRFDEPKASDYIRQIIEALKYLHSKNIIHRDIKPENILVDGDSLKLADFGWSIHTPKQKRKTFWGTMDYLPPEMIRNDFYDKSVDIWSVGVLTYELCSGYAPFHAAKGKDTYEKIRNTKYTMFKHFSNEVKDFIMKLLRKNPEDRMSLEDALSHPFITNHLKSKDKMMRR